MNTSLLHFYNQRKYFTKNPPPDCYLEEEQEEEGAQFCKCTTQPHSPTEEDNLRFTRTSQTGAGGGQVLPSTAGPWRHLQMRGKLDPERPSSQAHEPSADLHWAKPSGPHTPSRTSSQGTQLPGRPSRSHKDLTLRLPTPDYGSGCERKHRACNTPAPPCRPPLSQHTLCEGDLSCFLPAAYWTFDGKITSFPFLMGSRWGSPSPIKKPENRVPLFSLKTFLSQTSTLYYGNMCCVSSHQLGKW